MERHARDVYVRQSKDNHKDTEDTKSLCDLCAFVVTGSRNSVLRERFVRIAVEPALARLGGRDYRVAGRVGVFAGVPVG